MKSKVIGSMFLVAGTSIGAGMLAMPISTAPVGFGVTFIQLLVFLFILLIPALVIVELAQFAPRGTSVSGLIRIYWGKIGFTVSNVLLYVFVYSLMCAYISGLTSIFSTILNEFLGIDVTSFKNIFTVILVLIFGSIVVFTQRLADLINRVFFVVMIGAFVLLILIAIFKIDVANLSSLPVSSKVLFKSLPIFFTSYGFHIVIPSIYDYLDGDAKDTRTAIIGGLFITFIIFLMWNLVIHGLVSQAKLIADTASGSADISKILEGQHSTSSQIIHILMQIFTVCAITTSFIGCAISLVTTLKENFATKDSRLETPDVAKVDRIESNLGPVSSFFLAFALPTVVILFYPEAFYFFIQAAGIIFAIQSLVLPCFVLCQHRETKRELYQFGRGYQRLETEQTAIETTFNKDIYRLVLSSGLIVVVAIICFELSLLDSFVQFLF